MGCTVYVHCLWACGLDGYSRPSIFTCHVTSSIIGLTSEAIKVKTIASQSSSGTRITQDKINKFLSNCIGHIDKAEYNWKLFLVRTVSCFIGTNREKFGNLHFLKYLRPNPITCAQDEVILDLWGNGIVCSEELSQSGFQASFLKSSKARMLPELLSPCSRCPCSRCPLSGIICLPQNTIVFKMDFSTDLFLSLD